MNADYIQEVEKFNPYHDARGRFTFANSATSFTIRTRAKYQQRQADSAIAREKERYSNSKNNFSSKISGKTYKMPKLENEEAENNRKKALDRVERAITTGGKVNPDKFDEKMKRYLEETDSKEWEKRANQSRSSAITGFVTAKTPKEREEQKAREDDNRRMRAARERAWRKGTSKTKAYNEYEQKLKEKYSTKNGLNFFGDWYSKTTPEEKQKLKELDNAIVSRDKNGKWRVAKRFDYIEEIEKFNPYHDARGRFTFANSASSVTFRPGASRAHDNALERERIKQNHYYGKDRAEVENAWNELNAGLNSFAMTEKRPMKRPYGGIETLYYDGKLRDYEARLKDAEDMLAYMDKYGTNNAAKDKHLSERKKKPSSEYDVLNDIYERDQPPSRRAVRAVEAEEYKDTLRRARYMANDYKRDGKKKQNQNPEFTQIGLF